MSAGMGMYIPGNVSVGLLNGAAIPWQRYGDNALLGLLIFMAIVLVPFLVHFFSRKIWKTYVVFLSVLLICMQAVPLGIILGKELPKDPENNVHYVMEKDNEYVLGGRNIVVFILDYTSPLKMDDMLRVFPDVLEPFHDFLFLSNLIRVSRDFPRINLPAYP